MPILRFNLAFLILLTLNFAAAPVSGTNLPQGRGYSNGQNAAATIAVSPRLGRSGLGRAVEDELERILPRDITVSRHGGNADYVVEIDESFFDTNLRARDRRDQWAPASGRDSRIAWTEVSGEADVRYSFTLTLTQRATGRTLDYDRFQGNERSYVQWGEDLRLITPSGTNRHNSFPNSQVRALFGCAPDAGGDLFAEAKNTIARNLAQKAAEMAVNAQRQFGNGNGRVRSSYNSRSKGACTGR